MHRIRLFRFHILSFTAILALLVLGIAGPAQGAAAPAQVGLLRAGR